MAKKKVMVIDDSILMLRISEKILGERYDVFLFSDGPEALAAVKNIRPDLILLDVIMPELDGFAMISILKEDPDTSEIPVIFLTSLDDEANEKKGFELGGVDYIKKPFSESIVNARVNTHITLYAYRQKIKELITCDALTGVLNRRGYDEALRNEWQKHREMEQPFAMLLIDIDHFKLYNDHYGHQKGDEVLFLVAQKMKATLQGKTSILARYGGEEFAVILPNTDVCGCLVIGEEILKAVQGLKIAHESSLTGPVVTISIGADSVIPTKNAEAEDFFKTVDALLYLAKNSGRNCVACKD